MNKQISQPLFKHRWLVVAISLVLAVAIIGLPTAAWASSNASIPTFSIKTVVTDTDVTIKTSNFPASQTFTVRMGLYGTLGVGGVVVGKQDSGSGGTFTATYAIPAELKGKGKIAIRLNSPQGYYAYNWFFNDTSVGSGTATATPANTNTPMPTVTPGGPTVTPTAIPAPTATSGPSIIPPKSGYPYSKITAVKKGKTVTIQVSNFTKNDIATIRMGKYGTLGKGGTLVTAVYITGSAGKFTATFNIPAELASESKIAIRITSNNTPYYLYNWFWNNDH